MMIVLYKGLCGEGSMTEAPQRRLYKDGLERWFHEKVRRRRLQHARGDSEAAARVCEKIVREESPPCPHDLGII